MKLLILGGTRSGKSRLALQKAVESGLELVFIATATAVDDEMSERILAHQRERQGDWKLIEEPISIASVLQQETDKGRCVVVDCLTLWLSNMIGHDKPENEDVYLNERNRFIDLLPDLPGSIILVSNEVGMGIVPMNALARYFRDELGRLHQEVATICDTVILTIAGIPQTIKGNSQ